LKSVTAITAEQTSTTYDRILHREKLIALCCKFVKRNVQVFCV